MRIKKVKIPLYFDHLVMVQSDDWEEVKKEYNLKVNMEGFSACMFKNDLKNGQTEYVIAYGKEVSNSIIAHECIHFINAVFIDRMIELDRHNDEPQAYLMGWVFEQNEIFINNNKK